MANMTITAPGHPSGRITYGISVPTLNTGINIFNPHNATEGVARHFRWPYYRIVSSSSFDFIASFASYAARIDFTEWMGRYMRLLADDVATDYLRPMRFEVPARKFVKEGIPLAVQHGDDVRNVVHPLTINVKGGSSPVEALDMAISHYAPQIHATSAEHTPRYPDTLKAIGRISSERGDIFRTSEVLSAAQLAQLVANNERQERYTGQSPNSGRLA